MDRSVGDDILRQLDRSSTTLGIARVLPTAAVLMAFLIIPAMRLRASTKVSATDRSVVAALDTQYQSAVKRNDAASMECILADDFVLVTGSGKIYTKTDLLTDARRQETIYQHNEEEAQTVRIWGNTAVVTARLWEKGSSNGIAFDHKLWFSDTYVRSPQGWKYVFGQSSLPLPITGE